MFDFAIVFVMFLNFKFYTSVWKYASVLELLNIVLACSLSEIIMFAYKAFFSIEMPRSFFLIQFFLLIMFTCFSRLGYRLLRTIYIITLI